MSTFPTDAWNQRDLLDAADAAMYAAKRVDRDGSVPARVARSAGATGVRSNVAIDA
jgi:GGDEF domain-containing protein